MPQFRTTLPPTTTPFPITHQDQVLAIGSCFAEHIAQRLQQHKFPTLLNPFGILYNPISIAECLQWLLEDRPFPKDLLFEHLGLWHSFSHHGRFSTPTQAQTHTLIQEHIDQGRTFLKNTNRLLLTFGTANVFEYNHTQQIVANCHKRPNTEFTRKRLTVEQIVTALSPIFENTHSSKTQSSNHPPSKTQNSKLKTIITLSPVRHIRDGLIENQRSKAVLLLAIDELCRQFPNVHYFPSYELLLDDLRDYRFYADDLIHPSDMAIDYIWDYFGQTFFPQETQQLNKQIQSIVRATQHRPFHPESEQYQAFLRQQREKLEQLIQQYPDLDWEKELSFFGTTRGTKQG